MPLDVGRVTHLIEQMHRSEDDAGDPIDADMVLVTDGARGFTWEAYGGGSLSDLSDVTITSVAENQVLMYNGSVWVNTSLFWRPLMDGAGAVITDGETGEAIMALA